MEESLSLVICLMLILAIFVPILNKIEQEENIINFDIENSILIDNFISFDRAGNARYYLIYQSKDGIIKEFNVDEEKYYKSINLEAE